MKIRQQETTENVGFNMTPMIDIVFQLILFFMLIVDMSQEDLEEVILPIADQAREDKLPDQERWMINISHHVQNCGEIQADRPCRIDGHWAIVMRKKAFDFDGLVAELRQVAALGLAEDGSGISNRPVMVRADKRAPYEQIQKVLAACALNRIWRIDIGAAIPLDEKTR